jgi:hypothetical protein
LDRRTFVSSAFREWRGDQEKRRGHDPKENVKKARAAPGDELSVTFSADIDLAFPISLEIPSK